jgi:hypothetical protein
MKKTELTERFQARMPSSLLQRVDVLAAVRREEPRDVVIAALEDYLPGAEKEASAELKLSGHLSPSVLSPSV